MAYIGTGESRAWSRTVVPWLLMVQTTVTILREYSAKMVGLRQGKGDPARRRGDGNNLVTKGVAMKWCWAWTVAGVLGMVCSGWGQTSGGMPTGGGVPTIPSGSGPLVSPTVPPPPSPGVGIPTPGLPGQVIATSYHFSPPLPQPQALPRVGVPVGLPVHSPLMVPYDPRRPVDPLVAAGLDPKQLVTPVQGYGDQTFFDRFLERVKKTFGLSTVTVSPPPNVTPGIFRRNREALRQRLWVRD